MTEQNTKNFIEATTMLSSEIGTEMQIEIPGLEKRIKLNLIGQRPNQYIIFHLPEKLYNSIDTDALSSGNKANIRCISRGAVFGFQTNVIKLIVDPDNLLFIQYPEKIQKQEIRKSQRVKCLLPARLYQEGNELKGTVADISRTGCHFQIKKESLSIEQIKLTREESELKFAISLPGLEGDQIISTVIKSNFVDDEKVQIGLQFINVDQSILSVVDHFITMSFDLSPY